MCEMAASNENNDFGKILLSAKDYKIYEVLVEADVD